MVHPRSERNTETKSRRNQRTFQSSIVARPAFLRMHLRASAWGACRRGIGGQHWSTPQRRARREKRIRTPEEVARGVRMSHSRRRAMAFLSSIVARLAFLRVDLRTFAWEACRRGVARHHWSVPQSRSRREERIHAPEEVA